MNNRKQVVCTPFPELMQARFIRRINRFVLECELDGRPVKAFLPNPGRLQELLLADRSLYLIKENGKTDRTTKLTAVSVVREGFPVMLHTHKTNFVVKRLVEEGLVPGLEGATIIRQEVTIGRSRFDFLLKDGDSEIVLEVKSCTLAGKDVAMFPDAVTVRGARHLNELASLSSEGVRGAVIFVVHWPLASVFMPDYHTDLDFARTMLAVRESIRIIPLSVQWLPDLSLSRQVRLLDIPWHYIEREAQDRGSYIIILELQNEVVVDIGKLGSVSFSKGFYLYVGSAMNALSKRIERHRRLRKRPHWHIDHLRHHARLHAVLPIRSSDRLECLIADSVNEIAEWSIRGFGCSDCECESHLFAVSRDPLQSPEFQKIIHHFRMDRYQSALST